MIIFQALTARHDTSRFRSSLSALDTYLQRDALREQEDGTSRVFVLVEEDATHPIGYFALTATGCFIPAVTPDRQPVPPERFLYPVLLAFLARDLAWRGRGLGDVLLLEALKQAEQASRHVGFPGILLNTTKEGALLYERFGFVWIDRQDSYLYLPMNDIRAILTSTKNTNT